MTATPVAGDTRAIILVGTDKGLFRIHAGDGRRESTVEGPWLPGYRVLQVVASPTRAEELLATVDHPVWGAHLYRSEDAGERWDSLASTPRHPAGRYPKSFRSVWSLAWSPDGRTLYAGVDPPGLFASEDGGASWQDLPSLHEHPTRSAWEPSRGLFAVHSVCVDADDPSHLVVGVSAGGVYVSADAGATWAASNAGVRAENLPERFPVAGHNVHRVVMHPRDGSRLYRQCYSGTYRSDDGGRSWTEITTGLPSDFGYAIACDPFDANTVYQIPESSSHLRTTVDGRLRVFRSRDAGSSWQSASDGLPQRHAYVTVLREAMDADRAASGRVCFGTSSGHVFLTLDAGGSWSRVAEFLPRVLSVRFVG